MRTLLGLLLSVVFSLAVAAGWVALSRVYDTWLLVILAGAVGSTAGYGMALGSRGKGGTTSALVAALVCLGSCLAAKGAIAYFRASEFVHEQMTATDEDVYDDIASQIFTGMAEDGELTLGDLGDGYPPVVIQAADDQWERMSPQDLEDYRVALTAQWSQHESVATGATSVLAFLFSWSLLDIVCVCSGVGAAYKVGAWRRAPDDAEMPAWALGQASATGNPMTQPGSLVPGPACPAGPAVVLPVTPPVATAASPAASMTREDPGASFWTRLGAEPPSRNTPSLRRDPKPQPAPTPRADAA